MQPNPASLVALTVAPCSTVESRRAAFYEGASWFLAKSKYANTLVAITQNAVRFFAIAFDSSAADANSRGGGQNVGFSSNCESFWCRGEDSIQARVFH